VQGVVTTTLNLFRQGGGGFIGWLDGRRVRIRRLTYRIVFLGRSIWINEPGNTRRSVHQPERENKMSERLRHEGTECAAADHR